MYVGHKVPAFYDVGTCNIQIAFLQISIQGRRNAHISEGAGRF